VALTEAYIISRLERRGWRGRITPAHHIRELKEEIDDLYRKGQIDFEPYEEYFREFAFNPPDEFVNPSSLIVVAMPQHYAEVHFSIDGRQVGVTIPANYLSWRENRQKVEDVVKEIMAPGGYSVFRVYIPLKLLAVRSGLAEYGRNNIAYVPGMGSFHALQGFLSDFPSENDTWHEKKMMQVCEQCAACRLKCPTSAITKERFTLHAGRCIPFHNERSSDVPFPAWLDPLLQESLVGCMHCQKVCPANKEFLTHRQIGPSFTDEETAALLRAMTPEELPHSLLSKLKEAGMIDIFDVIRRNLPPLLDARKG
jgi:epoxyqueuosine reductase